MKKQHDDNGQKNNSVSLRGRTFRGVVIADAMQKTVTVEWERRKHVPKYERYEKKRTRIKAHNPENINAKKGDLVEIQECRPMSKTKSFVIVKKVGEERLFAEREQALEASKVKKKAPEKKQEESKTESEKVEEPALKAEEESKDESS